MRLEQKRAERRTESQRDDQRDDGRRGDGDGKLPEELAENAGEEHGRDEHGGEHKGDRDQRPANLLHGLVGGVARTEALADVAFDILHHDDGVVDHDADGE